MFSWYNLILKLQMSELLKEPDKNTNITVLESIVKTLAKGQFHIISEFCIECILLLFVIYFDYFVVSQCKV